MTIPNRDILQIVYEVNKELSVDHPLTKMAKRSGWSKFHFHREFQRVTGESPKSYIQRVRLTNAAAALSSSKKSVLQIAFETGFKSQEVFIRAFKKQFNCTPSQHRKNASVSKFKGKPKDYEVTINTISPCVGLYQIRENSNQGSRSMATPEIKRITIEPQPILYIQRQVAQSELQPTFAECFGKLFGFGVQHALPITGNPIARYQSMGPGLWTVDCVLPLAEQADSSDDLQAGNLESGDVIKATHLGPYEDLESSYIAIQAFMEKEGLSSRGAHWEQYVTDPGDEPDPSKWQTDIYWPVK